MGCVKSKEDKGPTLKYRPDPTNPTPGSQMGLYGPDPTQMGLLPALKGPTNNHNSRTTGLTPFGGSTSVITPFGGAASSSFSTVAVSNPFPGVVTGEWMSDKSSAWTCEVALSKKQEFLRNYIRCRDAAINRFYY